MSDEQFDLDAYIEDHDAYVATREANVAYVGGNTLSFYLAIDPSEVIRPIYERTPAGSEQVVRRHYAEAIETALASVDDPSHPVTSRAQPWGGPKTGGPIPDQTYLVQLLGFALGGIATVVLLADFAEVVKRLIDKAKALTRNDVAVSDGLAIILAAEAIHTRTGDADLALAFVTPLSEYLPGLSEMESPFDGWLVGFRTPTELRVVHVDRLGGVSVPDPSIAIDWTAR